MSERFDLEDECERLRRERDEWHAAHNAYVRLLDDAQAALWNVMAERDRLREAVALHSRTLDDRARGFTECDRDAVDVELYNKVREFDPEWWDRRVPGLTGPRIEE